MADKKKAAKKAAKQSAKQSNRVEKNKKVDPANNKLTLGVIQKKRAEKKSSRAVSNKRLKQLKQDADSLALNEEDLDDAEIEKKQDAYQELIDAEEAVLEELDEEIAKLNKEEEDLQMLDEDGTNADKTHPDPQESDMAEIGSQDGSNASTKNKPKSEQLSNPTNFGGHGNTPSDPITEDEMDLLRPSHQQPTSDLENPDKHRSLIVVKNGIGGGKIGIVKYGPPNAAIFRREDVTGFDLSNVKDISKPSERLGEKCTYLDNGTKVWEYTRRHLISVQGIAFPESCSLKKLKRKRRGDGVHMPIDVLIKWKKDGIIEHSWETTTSFRRIWGKHADGSDAAIRQAAEYAQKRFDEWHDGQRPARNRSPTVDPDFGKSKSKKKGSKSKKTASKSKNKKGKMTKTRGKSKKGGANDEDVEDEDEEDEDEDEDESDDDDDNDDEEGEEDEDEDDEDEGVRLFKKAWCMMNNKGKDFNKLSAKDKVKATKALALSQNLE